MRFAMGAMLVCVLVTGCGKPAAKTDDTDEPTSSADSGPVADSGTKPDAGPSNDGGSGKDAGSADSGGSGDDAGSDDDGGSLEDAGSVDDGGASDDAGPADDGGSADAGSDFDGGPGCTSDCTSLGASRCASTDIEYCLETAEDCLQWVKSPCPDGERCFGDPALCITIGTCTDDCTTPLATRCANSTELETCEVGSDGCLHWAASSCSSGDTCGGSPAECQTATCTDDCTTFFDTRCASATELETCDYVNDECLHWVVSTCSNGETCGGTPAECQTATCTDDCTTFFDTRCASATELETCESGTDNCLHWVVSTCSNGETCGGTPAECQTATCTDECDTVAATECLDTATLRTCETGTDGCRHWKSTACATNEACSGTPAACSSDCAVEGTLSGLAAGATLTLTDGAQDLTLTADGAFAFAISYMLADPFSVSVKTQPAGQTCTISVGTGAGSCSADTSVTVGCVTDPLPPALSLSPTSLAFSSSMGGSDPAVQTVTVSNSGEGVLALPSTTVEYTSGAGWLTPTISGTNAPFTLELRATLGSLTAGTYRAVVHVSAAGASNSPADLAVTFEVATPPAFRVGGDVSGLLGTLVLQNNGGDDLTLSANGPFTFANRVDDGAAYSISVKTHPVDQTCTVTRGTGRISGADVTDVQVSCGPSSSNFTVAGRIEFDWVPALDDVTEGGVRLDYVATVSRPARRVMIQALDTSDDSLVAQTLTRDDGTFTLAIPRGKTVRVLILARSTVTNYQRDGIGPDNCHGASWDLRLVDNTSGGAQYAMQSPSTYSTTTTDLDLRAPVEYSGGRYTSRSGAPFAILDTLVSEFELICTGQADLTLPLLNINWSPNNTSSSGDRTTGAIGTSHYRRETDGTSALYILGKEDVDTDEFDDHVIAHEGGHFLESVLYRSDSIGGTHAGGDSLDPRVAFGEGFGNALSAMVFTDPNYVDSSGAGQANGMTLEIAATPIGDDRGVYSEGSMQYFLWKLFDARNAAPNLGSFDRIHAILMQHRTTAAFTCGQTFAALYNAAFGDADGLRQLWEVELATPYGSLCSGNCSGSAGGSPDLFDLDNDLGLAYGVSSARHYPQETGLTYGPEFWRLYPLLAVGSPRDGEHEQIATGGYDAKNNKFGATRWYRILGTGGAVTLTISNLQGGASCTDDVLDLLVFKDGTLVTWDEETSGPTAGCPQVTLDSTEVDAVYTVDVRSFGTDLSNYTITLQ